MNASKKKRVERIAHDIYDWRERNHYYGTAEMDYGLAEDYIDNHSQEYFYTWLDGKLGF